MRGLAAALLLSLATTACAKAQPAASGLTADDLRCIAATAYDLDGEGEMTLKMSIFTYYLGRADGKADPAAVVKALKSELKTLTAEEMHAAVQRCGSGYTDQVMHLTQVAGEVQGWINRKVKEQERQQKSRKRRTPES
ncbi:hypothetical protein [Caulobacter sp. NIBR2454]|uniref:hypothetical protein n=1 Tax=Caulobacter sp. NIBR2454 TaxID=3015996 RepID=UPI0022B632B5|nr:hypothetical protein [Caulobacter sp. NIBR2454]